MQQLVIKDIGPGLVPIDGEWQFHLGDDARWANPKCDDTQWEQIKADDTWLMGVLAYLPWMRNRGQKLFLWFALWLLTKVALYYLSSDRVIELMSATRKRRVIMHLPIVAIWGLRPSGNIR